MERLLTDTQIGDLIDLEKEFTYPCSDGSLTSTIDCREVVEAEHKATLKAVGEWLKKSISLDELWAWEPDIETLLRGEMPEDN